MGFLGVRSWGLLYALKCEADLFSPPEHVGQPFYIPSIHLYIIGYSAVAIVQYMHSLKDKTKDVYRNCKITYVNVLIMEYITLLLVC